MGLVSSMSRKEFFLLGYEDAIAALTDNLYLLLNRGKIAKLKLENRRCIVGRKDARSQQPLVDSSIVSKDHQGG